MARRLYSSQSRAFISGVGHHDNHVTTWTAPLPVLDGLPATGHDGFVLHDACWLLLQRAFQPDEIPLGRLLEVCQSLPFPYLGSSINWGHYYGGLYIPDDQCHYPWEDQRTEGDYNEKMYSYVQENPYNVPEIPPLLAMRLEHPPEWLPKTQRRDCFSRLPWEILEAVAIKLPTGDALGLRLVSKAFLPLISSGIFWASRFEAGGDRDFIFEKRKSRDTTDWKNLYRLTGHANNSPGLRNRKRIWDLIRPLADLISLRLAEGPGTACEDRSFANLTWSKVVGDIIEEASLRYPRGFCEGCRLFGTHRAHVPKHLSKISFSIISISNVSYVTGVRLITEKGPDICLGLVSEGNGVTREVTALRGFILAAGSRGIRALKVVGEDGSPSEWVGRPNNSPITERLARFNSVAALEVGFDGYKIVSFGVSEEVSPSVQTPKVQNLSLRETALWYPTVPESTLCVNEMSFPGENPSSARYQPIFWIHFGGAGGRYLRHITGVSICHLWSLGGLEFHYDTAHGPAGARKLGRYKATITSKISNFPIDGAGGELIETLEVGFECGDFTSIKITTNRKRSFHSTGLIPSGPMKPVAIAPGTTLTGLYCLCTKQVGVGPATFILKTSVVDKKG
ncbi:hypothetical protein GP486_004412 [Trichoglossum hirsutum]|uniref:F-box domain-containing protein n=1 Tax=Trichoglossum hirsutum TaxID=265104 RepID=A0A9P8LAW2_9PEZI|nr:hypothetical protein GP486_004412 [Trichoglossum hirsutum]